MKITEHCFAVLGLGYYPPWFVNSGFIIGTEKTLVIDSGPNYIGAQTIYGYAKSVKPENEILLINTERHLDHIGGNSLFKEKNVKIYGHELIYRKNEDLADDIEYYNRSILDVKRKAAKEERIFFENTRIVNPEFHVKNGEIISLDGNIDVNIIFTPGHTQSNISIYQPNEKVLYNGDCIINGFIPNLDAGTKNDWQTWIKSLEIISSLDISYIIPGHGNVISGENVKKEISRMQRIIEEAIQSGKSPTSL